MLVQQGLCGHVQLVSGRLNLGKAPGKAKHCSAHRGQEIPTRTVLAKHK